MTVLEDAPDKPPVGFVTLIVLISFGFVFVVWMISYPFIDKWAAVDKSGVSSGMGNAERLDYLKKENEVLSSYKDLGNGYYQIAIDKAMEKVVRKQGDVFQN